VVVGPDRFFLAPVGCVFTFSRFFRAFHVFLSSGHVSAFPEQRLKPLVMSWLFPVDSSPPPTGLHALFFLTKTFFSPFFQAEFGLPVLKRRVAGVF